MSHDERGPALNKRVEKLFSTVFEIESEPKVALADGVVRTPDLRVNVDKKRMFFVENKAGRHEKLGELISDAATLKARTKAVGWVLVVTGIEPDPPKVADARKHGIWVWTEAELVYLENVVAAVGKHARAEILHWLGLLPAGKGDSRSFLALRGTQPDSEASGCEVFLFSATPAFLLEVTAIFRRSHHSGAAYQRMVQKKRIERLAAFVSQPKAILPPALVVALGDAVRDVALPTPEQALDGKAVHVESDALRVLEIPRRYGALELIDGQHRLLSFARVADPNLLETFELSVVGLRGLSEERRKDTFVAINDNARRMDANLVALLRLTPNEDACRADPALMAIRIALALDMHGALKGRVRSLDYQRQVVTLKGLSGYDLKTLVGPKSELLKHVVNDSAALSKVLGTYFAQVKRVFAEEWKDQAESIICTNRGLAAFLKLYKSMLRDLGHPPTPEEATEVLQVLRENWVGKSWKRKEIRSYAGGQGAADLHADMVRSIRRRRKSFDR